VLPRGGDFDVCCVVDAQDDDGLSCPSTRTEQSLGQFIRAVEVMSLVCLFDLMDPPPFSPQ
ncbi:hypothetical protein M3G07_09600, partial [Corynebacterium sanguinis]|uniref:hypothetical protein n=1 Tax=Corynebacterium sanguinis TaxID=2594913 RepID=UPI00223C526D